MEFKARLQSDRLRIAREKSGLTQHELARICGIGLSQITRYENGVIEPAAVTLGNIAQVLNVSVDYLLGLSDTTRDYSPDVLRPDERQLLDAYNAGDGMKILVLVYERLQKLMKLPTSSDETTPE